MSGLTIRELVTKFGFDIDDEKLKKFEQNVETTVKGLAALVAAAGAAAAGLFAIVKSASDAGDEIAKTSELIGISVEDFQQYRHAAALAGVGNGEFVTSLQYLTRNIGEAVRGSKPLVETFASLGISVDDLKTKSKGEILRQLSEGLAKIDDQGIRASISMEIFGRSGLRMGRFLQQGTGQLDENAKTIKALGFFTAETAAQAEAAGDAFANVLTIFEGLKNEVGIRLLPLMKSLSDRLTAWAVANSEVIKSKIDSYLQTLIGFLEKVWFLTSLVARGVRALTNVFGGFENAVKLVFVALASLWGTNVVLGVARLISMIRAVGLAAIVAQLQVLALPAAIALLIGGVILLFEDIYTYLNGGDSFIGWFAEWLDMKSASSMFAAWFNALLDVIAGFWQIVIGIFTLNGDLLRSGFEKVFGDLWQLAKDGLKSIWETITEWATKIKDGIESILPDWLKKGLSAAVSITGKIADKADEKIGKSLEWVDRNNPLLPEGANFALAGNGPSSAARSSVVNSSSQSRVENTYQISVPVTVPAGTSAQQSDFLRSAAKQVFGDTLMSQVLHAQQNHPRAE